jgi:hypothetical protein
MTRIPVNPELLTWARGRAGLDALVRARRFPTVQRARGLPPTTNGE